MLIKLTDIKDHRLRVTVLKYLMNGNIDLYCELDQLIQRGAAEELDGILEHMQSHIKRLSANFNKQKQKESQTDLKLNQQMLELIIVAQQLVSGAGNEHQPQSDDAKACARLWQESVPPPMIAVPCAVVRTLDKNQGKRSTDIALETGEIVWLQLQSLKKNSSQRVLCHPRDYLHSKPSDNNFTDAIEKAFNSACEEIPDIDDLTTFDGYWRLVDTYGEAESYKSIEGESIGAAALLAWYLSLSDKIPDDGVIVLGKLAVKPNQLEQVDGVTEKSEAVGRSLLMSSGPETTGFFDTLVVMGDNNQQEAVKGLIQAGFRESDICSDPMGITVLENQGSGLKGKLYTIRVLNLKHWQPKTTKPPEQLPPAQATIDKLLKVRSQLVEDLSVYLNNLAKLASELPKYYGDFCKNQNATPQFDQIRQRVQVIQERLEYQQYLRDGKAAIREEMRAAGHKDHQIENRLYWGDDVYAPQRSRPEMTERDELQSQKIIKPPPPVDWDEAANKFNRAIILGDPGFGKTWLLKYEARRRVERLKNKIKERNWNYKLDEFLLPIYVRFYDLCEGRGSKKKKNSLKSSLLNHWSLTDSSSGVFNEWVKSKLNKQQCSLLLDGLDEVPEKLDGFSTLKWNRNQLCQQLKRYLDKQTKIQVLITSRIANYPGLEIEKCKELELLAFSPPLIEALAGALFNDEVYKKTFMESLQKHHQVEGLARIPLLLTLLCRVYKDDPEQFPEQRTDLYKQVLKGLLEKWKEEKVGVETGREIEVDEYLKILAQGAFTLQGQYQDQFSSVELIKACNFDDTVSSESKEAFFIQLVEDGILSRLSEGVNVKYIFLHRTFQEYLAAKVLAKKIPTMKDNKLKSDYLNVIRWTEPLVLVMEMLETEEQAVQVVRLSLTIDYELAARLAGSAKPAWQKKTILLIVQLKTQKWFHPIPLQRSRLQRSYWIQLLGITKSPEAVPSLLCVLKIKRNIISSVSIRLFQWFVGYICELITQWIPFEKCWEDISENKKEAITALSKISPEEKRAIPILIILIEDCYQKDEESIKNDIHDFFYGYESPIAPQALESLLKYGADVKQKVPTLTNIFFGSGDYALKLGISKVLVEWDEAEAVLNFLVEKTLNRRDFKEFSNYVDDLTKFGVEAEFSLNRIWDALNDDQKKEKAVVAESLWIVKPFQFQDEFQEAIFDDVIAKMFYGKDIQVATFDLIVALLKQIPYQYRLRYIQIFKLGNQLLAPDRGGRQRALNTLKRIGDGSIAVINILIHCAETDDDEDIKREARYAVQKLNNLLTFLVPEYVKLAKSKDVSKKIRAIRGLGLLGTVAASAVIKLFKEIELDDYHLKCYMIDSIGCMGENAIPAVPKLIEFLHDSDLNKDLNFVLLIFDVLKKIGPAAHSAVPELILLLEHKDPIIIEKVLETLGEIGAEAASSVPNIIEILDNENLGLQINSIIALGKIGPASAEAVPSLTRQLKHWGSKKGEIHSLALLSIRALNDIGPLAAPAIPSLLKVLKSEKKVYLVSGITEYIDLDYEPESRYRYFPYAIKGVSAAEALGSIGSKAQHTTPVLIDALSYNSIVTRYSAAKALSTVGRLQDLVAIKHRINRDMSGLHTRELELSEILFESIKSIQKRYGHYSNILQKN